MARVADTGSGIDPTSLEATFDGRETSVRLRGRPSRIGTDGLAPGSHRLRLQLSDYQETRNNENVTRILPNTRVVTAWVTSAPRSVLTRPGRHRAVGGLSCDSRRWKLTMGRSSATASVARSRTPTTSAIRLRPPVAPSPLLRRERLLDTLAEALNRRLTTVVAGAGFGKSTLLSDWASEVNCAWYTASSDDASLAGFARGLADALRLRVPALPVDAAGPVTATAGPGAEQDETARARGFAAALCETLQAALRRDLVLVVDDVQAVAGSAGAVQVIESLCRQAPPRLHLVLASRAELPFPIERLRGQGQVLELAGAELAFDADETATLLASLAGAADAETAVQLQHATGGWPAAVRLAVEALRGVPPAERQATLDRIRRPGGPLLAVPRRRGLRARAARGRGSGADGRAARALHGRALRVARGRRCRGDAALAGATRALRRAAGPHGRLVLARRAGARVRSLRGAARAPPRCDGCAPARHAGSRRTTSPRRHFAP